MANFPDIIVKFNEEDREMLARFSVNVAWLRDHLEEISRMFTPSSPSVEPGLQTVCMNCEQVASLCVCDEPAWGIGIAAGD